MPDYDRLTRYLAACGRDSVTLSFDEISAIVGGSLPDSAFNHAAWWGPSHSHARAWLGAGFTAKHKKGTRSTEFVKTGSAASPRPEKAAESGGPCLDFGGHIFSSAGLITPESEKGRIREFYPQQDYDNARGLPLNAFGAGPFCRFRLDLPSEPGVYLWVCDNKVIYIGESRDLRQRFNNGYGRISPKNCYQGGRSTHCKMNSAALRLCRQGKKIEIFFLVTEGHKAVELDLLRKYNTPYNVKDN